MLFVKRTPGAVDKISTSTSPPVAITTVAGAGGTAVTGDAASAGEGPREAATRKTRPRKQAMDRWLISSPRQGAGCAARLGAMTIYRRASAVNGPSLASDGLRGSQEVDGV